MPCKWFYEPRYEYKGAPAERWAIGTADDEAFCVAGLWREWHFDGETQYGFTQITTDAIDHPLLNQFHKDTEKRGLIILPRSEYGEWLNVKDMEFARSMLTLLPVNQMKAWPAEKQYSKKEPKQPVKKAKPAPDQGSLF